MPIEVQWARRVQVLWINYDPTNPTSSLPTIVIIILVVIKVFVIIIFIFNVIVILDRGPIEHSIFNYIQSMSSPIQRQLYQIYEQSHSRMVLAVAVVVAIICKLWALSFKEDYWLRWNPTLGRIDKQSKFVFWLDDPLQSLYLLSCILAQLQDFGLMGGLPHNWLLWVDNRAYSDPMEGPSKLSPTCGSGILQNLWEDSLQNPRTLHNLAPSVGTQHTFGGTCGGALCARVARLSKIIE